MLDKLAPDFCSKSFDNTCDAKDCLRKKPKDVCPREEWWLNYYRAINKEDATDLRDPNT